MRKLLDNRALRRAWTANRLSGSLPFPGIKATPKSKSPASDQPEIKET